MKKILLSAISLCLIFSSCKRDDTNLNPDPREVTYNVTLADANFIDQSPLGSSFAGGPSSPAKLSRYFPVLEYYLYSSTGQRLAQQNFIADSSATGFTIPAAKLKPGTYTVVLLGRKEKSTGTSSEIYSGDNQNEPYLSHSIEREVTDLFYSSQQFEVKNEDAPVDIVLKRPGGKLKVIIQDEWPQNVVRISIAINGFTVFYPKSDRLDQRKDIYLPVTKTSVDCSYENFVFTNSSDITRVNATLIAYDKQDLVVAKKPIRDIKVERNKLTTLNVLLFDGPVAL